jgi:hypothetical protein
MSDLTVQVHFTQAVGTPATGLTLADIDLYLTEQDKATGITTVIWDGTQHPTIEVDNIGAYVRIYAGADMDANHYSCRGTYTGAAVLDVDHVTGATQCCDIPIGTAVEFTYTVTDSVTGLPLDGVHVVITTDVGGANPVWGGYTDAFGVARDIGGRLPRLDPGTYYFWKQLEDYTDDQNPDTEVVP